MNKNLSSYDPVDFLNSLLHSSILVSKHMGIRVSGYTGERIILEAPLNPNQNDKGTAFAGSLYSLAVLTGWSFVMAGLKDEGLDAEVVIHKGDIVYSRPVTSPIITACCAKPDTKEWDLFKNRVKEKSKGRINLTIEISDSQKPYVIFNAAYYGRKK